MLKNEKEIFKNYILLLLSIDKATVNKQFDAILLEIT